MQSIEVFFLGTGGSVPTRDRFLPSILVKEEQDLILVDAGEGAQYRFLFMGLGLNRHFRILVTHAHADHVLGLPGILFSLNIMGRTRPVEIYGPRRVEDFVKGVFETTGKPISDLEYKVVFKPVKEGLVFEGPRYFIEACRAEHGGEAYAYRISQRNFPGRFLRDVALAKKIPKRFWTQLQKGKAVRTDTGIILPSEVTVGVSRGLSIAVSGDTRPSKKLVEFFREVDLLVHEATFSHSDADLAKEHWHSTAVEAGMVAKDAGARLLALYHFSMRYQKDPGALVNEARGIFPRVLGTYDGLVLKLHSLEHGLIAEQGKFL